MDKKNRKLQTFTATVKTNPQGYAFLIPDGFKERENDYFIPRKKLNGAIYKDEVLAKPVRGTRDEAVIIKILKHNLTTVIGRFEEETDFGWVVPDDRAIGRDVCIDYTQSMGAKHGDKVLAEISDYPKNRPLVGRVIQILGRDGDLLCEEQAIIQQAELRQAFPEEVEKAAEEVAKQPIVLGGRRDFRDTLTITIDGVDTRDIDDAVSLEFTGDSYRLGVHIADVSHYVEVGGAIDNEAYERGTSVYFPDRVLPMLPKALSNGACSLNEGEDRYATSCIMTFSLGGHLRGYEICESVINSDKRMTYDEVTRVLADEKVDGVTPEITVMLKFMAKLCHMLESRRLSGGEVSLDVKEAHIYLDERGNIVIPDYERALSHRMIEQFMVSANECVARFAEDRNVPFLYRVHEQPSPEKARLLRTFLNDLGERADLDCDDASPAEYQKILKQVEGKPYESVVNKVMLRSMQKARYCEENLGHFGLASECYCHFTSPIRRYPDLFCHRVLKYILHGDIHGAHKKFKPVAKDSAVDCSERERRADLAERNVDDLYKVVYMSSRIGEEYDAVISGVTEHAIYAELPNTVEGMIRLENLPPDRYEFFAEKFLLKGRRHSFRIGDTIKVLVVGADLGTRKVQFKLI